VGPEIGCIVLAAGRSSRLGSPKALIEVGGVSLISWILTRLNGSGLRPVVVTRENLADEIRESVGDVEIIVNENAERGRTGSVKKGLSYLKERMRNENGALIVPVDRPGFSISTVELLVSSKSSSCPSKDGRGGHPLFVDRHDIERILQSASDEPLNSIIDPERILVEDPYLHLNIDTSEDVDEFLKVVDFL
jgi:molybdenum cofactor cytidylyltransferase|tara:strand:+ start:22 stop:597 length:576 start_codon:yes stop_codon:yes gene_type:complete